MTNTHPRMHNRFFDALRHAARGVSLLVVFASTAHSMFIPPEMVPVDRLVRNAEAYIQKHGGEADAHYTLGRIHYLAFSSKRDHAPALVYGENKDGKPRPAPSWMAGWGPARDDQSQPPGRGLSEEQLVGHAAKALRSFNEALRLDPKNGLYHLGLASLLDEFFQWKETARRTELPAELHGITIEKIRDAYSKAFSLAMVKDSRLRTMPIEGTRSITAYEAAVALVRLAQNSAATLSDAGKREVKEAEKAVAKFEKLPMTVVTPIVFSFRPVSHLSALLAPDASVDFDLRGYGLPERWPWVKPELGFVVWDPQETGSIRTARQLFGSYTFQIFWRTGYDALASLDDNADGVLSGGELDGISAWFDRNSDGQSAAGEVTPLRELDIVALRVRAAAYDGVHPTHPRGIILRDGSALRSWDWIVAPHDKAFAPRLPH